MQLYDKAPTVTLSGKGKLDVTDDTSITYTFTKFTNVNAGTVTAVTLAGRDADMFDVSGVTLNAKGQPQVELSLKDEKDYDDSYTYNIQLAVKLNGLKTTIFTPVQKIKVTF